MFKPSNKDLEVLGIGSSTYEENDFFITKISGICRWSTYYSALYFFCMMYAMVTSAGFAYGAIMEGEKEAFLETIHFIPLIFNMGTQVAAYHYNQEDYLELFRAIDRGFFDYADTIDESLKIEIAEIKAKARSRKSKFGYFYTLLLIGALSGHTFKKPVSYIMEGRGVKEVDGGNNLIWQGPFGMYIPYADYWIPYLIATLFCYMGSTCIGATAIGSVITYQYISEELLAQYAIVEKTFNLCVQRAERLHKLRRNDLETVSESAHHASMNDCLRQCVHSSIKHHHEILRMNDVFKRLMYAPLWMIIFDGALVLCISSYLIISDDVSWGLKLAMPGTIFSETVLVLIFCYYGEKITQASHDVGDAIYNDVKWVDYIGLIKPYAVIIKAYCDIPNELSAGGFTAVDHKAFYNILSTTYSYIGFMLST